MAQTIVVLMRHVPTQMARLIVPAIRVLRTLLATVLSALVSSKSSPILYSRYP